MNVEFIHKIETQLQLPVPVCTHEITNPRMLQDLGYLIEKGAHAGQLYDQL